ncbi:MAG: hypothetical protein ACXVEE_20785 [Polyangiales bacterium]
MATTHESKPELNTTLDELRKLRDEIRVQLHLAGMEAKDRWNRELEPQFFSLEKKIEKQVGSAARTAIDDLAKAMRRFRENLPH